MLRKVAKVANFFKKRFCSVVFLCDFCNHEYD